MARTTETATDHHVTLVNTAVHELQTLEGLRSAFAPSPRSAHPFEVHFPAAARTTGGHLPARRGIQRVTELTECTRTPRPLFDNRQIQANLTSVRPRSKVSVPTVRPSAPNARTAETRPIHLTTPGPAGPRDELH